MTPSSVVLKVGDLSPGARRCRLKFLRTFPGGFKDPEYVELEREYKWRAHQRWEAELPRDTMRSLLRTGGEAEVASCAVTIESRTNLLFSFEKMALRDAVRSAEGARLFFRGSVPITPWWGCISRFHPLVYHSEPAAPPADSGTHLAPRHGVRLHCSAHQAHFFQAPRDPGGGSSAWFRLGVHLATALGVVCKLPCVCSTSTAGHPGPRSP